MPISHTIDVERPEHGHERPKEQFPFFNPALNQGRDDIPSKPTLDGRCDRSGEDGTKALPSVNVLEAVAIKPIARVRWFQAHSPEEAP